MGVHLNPLQRRVLGVLMEKSLAQPEYYPMTLNAIVAACNQKSNRDPVMSAVEGDVAKAIWEMQQMGLVAQAEPDRNARANRFRHLTEEKVGWNARERAILAELLLRGPQTAGELRTHASRMMPLDNVAYVGELLIELSRRDPPVVRELLRGPAQSASRFAHTWNPPDEVLPVVGPMVYTPSASAALSDTSAASLEQRVSALESQVAALQAQIATMHVS